MSVRVVRDDRRGFLLRRTLRRSGTLLGGAMLTVGYLMYIPTAALLLGVIVSLFNGGSWDLCIAFLLGLALVVVGCAGGLRLVRGRRDMVLFLRRFRHGEAIDAVTSAVRRIGRTWRVVTLDDATIEAVGVAPGLRVSTDAATRVGAFVAWLDRTGTRVAPAVSKVTNTVVTVSLLGMFGLAGLVYLRSDSPGDAMATLVDYPHTPESVAAGALLLVFLGTLAVAGISLLAFSSVMISLMPFIGVQALYSEVLRFVRAAEEGKTARVRHAREIAEVSDSLSDLARLPISPKLIVVTVDSAVWRQTVTGLASVSSAPLIDVSRPTEHLLWEVEEMLRAHGPRCVFVGHLDRLRRFTGQGVTGSVEILAVPAHSLVGRLERLLDGREVLAYTTDRRGRKRLAKALFARFESLPRSPAASREDRREALLQCAAVAAFAAVLVCTVVFLRSLR
ncbi:hypothetical protein [Streptomyces sp. NPDC046909]|uniref:hypothetical protein n=1 Tax=Streptomyces sp. NPDC046909 TaxID=3155617 RepID=UPI0033DF2B3F